MEAIQVIEEILSKVFKVGGTSLNGVFLREDVNEDVNFWRSQAGLVDG